MIFLYIVFAGIVSFLYYKKTVIDLTIFQKFLLLILRFISLFLVGILIINPIINWSTTINKKPVLLVLRDISKSMETEVNKKSKQDYSSEALKQIEHKFKGFEVIQKDFADGVSGSKNSTNLSKTLLELKDEIEFENLKQIILLSDGWFKDKEIKIISDLHIPIITIQNPITYKQDDVKIVDVEFNKNTFQNQVIPFKVAINSNMENVNGKLKLYVDDRLVKSQKIAMNSKDYSIDFDYKFEKTGLFPFKFEFVGNDIKEFNSDNNVFLNAINVRKKKKEILVISDNLNWDLKILTDALSLDRTINHTFLQLRYNGFYQKNMRKELAQFLNRNTDLLIFINSNSSPKFVKQINKYLDNGGNLLMIGKGITEFQGSQSFSPNIDQIIEGHIDFTKVAKQFETFRKILEFEKELPPVEFYVSKKKRIAKTLAQSINNKIPLVLFSRVNQSKVLHFNFYSFWKWKSVLGTSSYNEFVNNLVMWLSTKDSKNYFAYTNKNHYLTGEFVKLSLEPFDEKNNFLLDSNNLLKIYNSRDSLVVQEFLKLKNGSFELIIDNLKSDKYHYTVQEESYDFEDAGDFIISSSTAEDLDIGYNNSMLSYISMLTNGLSYQINDLRNLEIKQYKKRPIKKDFEVEIYKKWWLLAIFLLAFCTELFLRKRWGLV
ncbi:MAG: hypothetical protein U9N34_10970 [Candidatus Cloacimonadota bacterium]|nr:hypothetical protein [Candidatus Cloacimonadota bacterium]